MANIVLLGAGGTAFTLKLLRDIMLTEGLSGSTLRLVDINESRLNYATSAATLYCEEAKSSIKIESYLERREAFVGADYVICAVKIGGYKPLEQERKIAEEQGYYRGIGDRVSCYFGGIGAYWQIRFLEEVADDMEELCPDALLIQTANPVFDGTNYITRNRRIKAVGVCHGHNSVYDIAKVLGYEKDNITFDVLGFNHHIFLVDFRHKGKDIYPELDKWISEKSETFWQSEEYLTPNEFGFLHDTLSKGAVDAYKLYGLYPIGDAIRSASPWWHHTDFKTKEKWYGIGGGFDSEIGWNNYLNGMDIQLEQLKKSMNGEQSISKVFPLEKSMESHIKIIEAMETDKYQRLILNIPNNGYIDNVPSDVLVEVPAIVSASGITGIRPKQLSRRVMDNIIYPRMRTMDNLHEAYKNGDRELLVIELMHDHRTKNFDQAKKLIDTLLDQPWNADANRHYK